MFVCFGLSSCTADWNGFFAPQFEDVWWQPIGMDWCFNFHHHEDTGVAELLVYENENIKNYGSWVFEEPSTYHVDDYSVIVWENDDCWDLAIEPYNVLIEDLYACECTTRE